MEVFGRPQVLFKSLLRELGIRTSKKCNKMSGFGFEAIMVNGQPACWGEKRTPGHKKAGS